MKFVLSALLVATGTLLLAQVRQQALELFFWTRKGMSYKAEMIRVSNRRRRNSSRSSSRTVTV